MESELDRWRSGQGSQLHVPRPEWVWHQLQTCEGLLWGREGRHELRTWEAEPGELSGNQYHFSLKKIFLHSKLATPNTPTLGDSKLPYVTRQTLGWAWALGS